MVAPSACQSHILIVFYVQASAEIPSNALAAANWKLEKEIEAYCASKSDTMYTFIRHPPLFDDIAEESAEISKNKSLTLPKGAEYWISRLDVVDAIVAVAFKPKKNKNATLDLLGPERLRGKKAVSIVGEVLQEEIKYVAISRSDLEKLQEYLVKSHGFSSEEAKRTAEYLKDSKGRSGSGEGAKEEQAAAERARDAAIAKLWSSSRKLETLREWVDAHAHFFL